MKLKFLMNVYVNMQYLIWKYKIDRKKISPFQSKLKVIICLNGCIYKLFLSNYGSAEQNIKFKYDNL